MRVALYLPSCPAQLSFPSPGTQSVLPTVCCEHLGISVTSLQGQLSTWQCLGMSHTGWMHSLNQQGTDPEATQGGWVQGGMAQGGRPPIPLQGNEAVLPGSGSRVKGRGQPGKCCPFGGSVALPWLGKLGKPVPRKPGCCAHPPAGAPNAALGSPVTKPAWSPRGYLP